MKNSCITYPERDPLVIIRKSQVVFCDGNVCAAALLSYFEYWHNIKLEMSPKGAALNVIAVTHGEEACHDESLYQFHKMEELSVGIMGLYKRDAIKAARKLLTDKGIITEHRNPSERYKFDNTVYYLFHPEILLEWLDIRYNGKPSYRQAKTRSTDITENRHIDIPENREPPTENREPPTENRGTITETSYKTSYKSVCVNACEEKPLTDFQEAVAKPIASELTAAAVCIQLQILGLIHVNPSHPDLLELLAKGATMQDFEYAGYEAKAKNKGFAWALKVAFSSLEDRLKEKRNPPPANANGRQQANRNQLSNPPDYGEYEPSASKYDAMKYIEGERIL